MTLLKLGSGGSGGSSGSAGTGFGGTNGSGGVNATGGAGGVSGTGGTSGSPNSNWYLNATQNWSNGGSTTVPNDKYFNLDTVNITSTAGSSPNRSTLTIPTGVTLQPASVTVTNDLGKDLTINTVTSGNGGLGGNMSLTKNGAGTLFLASPNTYTGTTMINNGKIVVTRLGGIVPNAGRYGLTTAPILSGGL